MTFETDQIRACRTLQELEHLWKVNVKRWSQLPEDQAKELIHTKDRRKADLQFERDVDAVVQELNRLWSASGCEMSDIPQERRDRALKLEEDMTQAANTGNYQKARDALEQWRVCWVPPGVRDVQDKPSEISDSPPQQSLF